MSQNSKKELALDIANQKLLVQALGSFQIFTDTTAYMEQAKRYNEAILKLGELQKEWEDATKS